MKNHHHNSEFADINIHIIDYNKSNISAKTLIYVY